MLQMHLLRKLRIAGLLNAILLSLKVAWPPKLQVEMLPARRLYNLRKQAQLQAQLQAFLRLKARPAVRSVAVGHQVRRTSNHVKRRLGLLRKLVWGMFKGTSQAHALYRLEFDDCGGDLGVISS